MASLGSSRSSSFRAGASSSSFTIQRRYSKGRPSLYSSTLYSLRRRYSSTSNCRVPTTPTMTSSMPE